MHQEQGGGIKCLQGACNCYADVIEEQRRVEDRQL